MQCVDNTFSSYLTRLSLRAAAAKHQRDISGGKLQQIRVITSSPHERLSPEVVSLLKKPKKEKKRKKKALRLLTWVRSQSSDTPDIPFAARICSGRLAFSRGLNEDVSQRHSR